MKAGWQTTEFWMTVASLIGLASQVVPQKYAPYVAIVASVYAAGRTLVKSLHQVGLAKQLPDLPPVGGEKDA